MAIDFKLLTIDSNSTMHPDVQGFNVLTGKDTLAQKVVKLLLTAKGSDALNPTSGSNLLGLYGVYSTASEEQIKAILPEIISAFVKDFKASQSQDIANGASIADEELLDDIIVDSIEYDKLYSGWYVRLVVKNKLQETIKISIP